MNFKFAAGIFFALVVGCSSDPGSVVEQTGSTEQAATTCPTTTLVANLTGGGGTVSTTQAVFTGYLPSTIAATNTVSNTAQIIVVVPSSGGNQVCTYNYPATSSTVFGNPTNACTGTCVYTYCPLSPIGHRFISVTSGPPGLTLSLTGGAGVSDKATAVFSDDASDGNPCTDDVCLAGGGISHNPSSKGADCPSDGNVCNGVEACNGAGACVHGNNLPSGSVCSDSNPCHVGTCNGSGTCSTVNAADGSLCPDTNVCDGRNVCTSGTCAAPTSVLPTNVSNGCDTTTCDALGGYVTTACTPSTTGSTIAGSAPTTLGDGAAFLYTGSTPVQTGVTAGTIDPNQGAVVRGQVFTTAGPPSGVLAGITISILNHPEYGTTKTRSDGWFDMAVNGGGELTVVYQDVAGTLCSAKPCVPVQRHVLTRWNQYSIVKDVVMTPRDTATAVTANGSGVVTVQGAVKTDGGSASRQASLIFPHGTTSPDLPGVTTWHVSPTEVTVGTFGPNAMPGDLPGASGYTYAVDLDIAEADSAGKNTVNFNQEVFFYVDQFTVTSPPPAGWTTGTEVPVGYYDRTKGGWIASDTGATPEKGTIVAITSFSGSSAVVDVGGSGISLGADEKSGLYTLYHAATLPKYLWRVPVKHFTAYDINWGFGPATTDVAPPTTPPNNPNPPPNTCEQAADGNSNTGDLPGTTQSGSFIECQNQSLDETIPVADTGYFLAYASRRSRYGNNRIEVPITDGRSLSGLGLLRIDVIIQVAGRREKFTTTTFAANQSIVWTWDRLDAYKRFVQGAQHASVEVDYVYPGTFGTTPNFGAYPTGTGIGGSKQAREVSLIRNYDVVVGGVDQDLLGFGGWTLSPAHVFDLGSTLLEKGDGTAQLNRDVGTVRTVAGNRTATLGVPADGSSALAASLYPRSIAVGHDGSVYIGSLTGNTKGNLYQVLPNGTIYTIAGNDPYGASDTFVPGAAVGAPISFYALAVDQDDSILVQDADHARVVRISKASNPAVPTGRTASLVAGSLSGTVTGHADGPVATATFGTVQGGLAVARDGTIYLGDKDESGDATWRIRRISTAGVVDTIAGSPTGTGYGGDSQVLQAANAYLGAVIGLAVDSVGSVYFSENGALVRKITSDGYVRHIAGDGDHDDPITGENGQANTAIIGVPVGIAIDSHDRLYITDTTHCLIRTVAPDGTIERYAGTITTASNCLGTTDQVVDGAAPQATKLAEPDYVAVGPDDSITFARGYYESVRTVAGLGGIFLVPSADGSEVYSFNDNYHVETKSGFTGAGLEYFCYDANGLLSKVIDETCAGQAPACGTTYANCETDITRSGSTVTIKSRYGKTTTLNLTSYGGATGVPAEMLASSVKDPTALSYNLTYRADTNGWTGLLATFADPGNVAAGMKHQLTYSTDGYLTQDQDPIEVGASHVGITLGRSWTLGGWNVNVATAEGRARKLGIDRSPSTAFPERAQHRTSQLADGTLYQEDWNNDNSRNLTLPDGTVVTTSFLADPRLGWGAKYASNITTTAALGTRIQKAYRTATLTDPTNPFSAATETDQMEINPTNTTDPTAFDSGRFYNRSVTYGTTRTVVSSSPVGRSVTQTFDSDGRLIKIHVPGGGSVPSGLADTCITYDSQGRIDHVNQGTGTSCATILRHHQNGYFTTGASTGLLDTVSDTIGGSSSFDTYDADDRVTQTTLPGLRVAKTAYNAGTKVSTVIVPNNYTHTFADNPDDLLATYTTPASSQTTYAYDNDRLLTSFLTPDTDTVGYGYDSAGRWTERSGAAAAYVTYDVNGKISSETANGLTYTYGYNGAQLVTITTSGLFSRVITYGYDSALRVASRKISPATTADTIGYDNDELLTSFGSLTAVNRDASNGILTGTTVNAFTDSYKTYNDFGELLEYDAPGAGSVYKETIVRDTAGTVGGRITKKTEVVNGGTPIVHNYVYDSSNRLMSDGSTTYTYDADGNRTDVCATYDSQDRFTCGGATYTSDGRMTADGTHTYTYDALGNLLTSNAAGGTTYTVDSRNRRLKKKTTSPAATQQFLYGLGPYPLAELDSSGNVVSTFYYGTGRNVPDYFVKGGHTYKIITDHVGSVRVVYDTTAAATVQVITYDAWGNVSSDTSPGFQPFGFAGGIYDKDTGLVRFGARDYNPRVGRWMTKDNIRFGGGINFYVYADNDAIDKTDASGNGPLDFFACLAGGTDFTTCWDDEANRINIGGPAGQNTNGDGFGGSIVPPTTYWSPPEEGPLMCVPADFKKAKPCSCLCYKQGVGPSAIGQKPNAGQCSSACTNLGYSGYKCGGGDVTWNN